jgi:hypothetical protein
MEGEDIQTCCRSYEALVDLKRSPSCETLEEDKKSVLEDHVEANKDAVTSKAKKEAEPRASDGDSLRGVV